MGELPIYLQIREDRGVRGLGRWIACIVDPAKPSYAAEHIAALNLEVIKKYPQYRTAFIDLCNTIARDLIKDKTGLETLDDITENDVVLWDKQRQAAESKEAQAALAGMRRA